jgi:hypothetical protein
MMPELKAAIDKVEQLPEEEQLVIARMIEAEMQWDQTLRNTQDVLSALANEALEEYKAGKTKKGEW